MNRPLTTRSQPLAGDRLDAIVRLLDARFYGLPEPRSVTLRTEPGFVHKTLAPAVCETCEGVDSEFCTGCGGRGWVERMRDRDPMAVDKVVAYGLSPDRREAERARDRQIQVLGDQIRPAADVDEAKVPPFAWERVRAKLYATTDMAALERAVEALHLANPGVSVYSDYGLTYLSERLPDPLRAPEPEPVKRLGVGKVERNAGDQARAMRDDEIGKAVLKDGLPTADAARVWGISVSQVNRIASKQLRKDAA